MIARKSFLIFLNMVIGGILGYVAMFFILRYMGAEDYGIIGFGMAYVGLFAFLSELGFNRAHIKRVSEGQDLEKCIGTFFVIKLVLTGVMITCVLFTIFLWKFVLGRGFETADHENVIYIFLVYHIFLNLSSVPITTFSARTETAKYTFSALFEPLVRVPLSILVAVGSYGVIALAGSYLIGVIILTIVALVLFRGYPFGKFDSKTFKSYFKFALPIALATSISTISLNVDKVMLQLFWGARFVGYYFTVQRLTTVLIFVSTAITVLLFPTLSEHHSKNEIGHIRRLTISAERYVSLIIMPCSVLLIVFSWPILNIFNNDLAQNAYKVLQIMALYSLFLSFYMIFINQIVAMDKPRLAVKIGISIALINISLNAILIPKDIKSMGINLFGLGAEGAALATVTSTVIGLIICKIITKRLTKTNGNLRIILHLAAALGMGCILYFINHLISIVRWYEIGVACFIGIGIYLTILYNVKEFTKEDLKLFLDILNPIRIKRYFTSELKGKDKNR